MKKKTVLRILAALMIAAIMLPMAAGCRNNNDDPFANPEFVFVPEFIELPQGINDIQGLLYLDGKIVFVTHEWDYDDETFAYRSLSRVNSVNLDGTGFGELEGYSPPVAIPDNVNGEFRIGAMTADGAGNLWVHEQWNLNRMNVPPGVQYGTDEFWENYETYYEDLGSGNAIRKLDGSGRELLTVDISGLSPDNTDDPYGSYFYINSFNVDGDGNIYVSAYTWDGMEFYVLDSNGALLFKLDTGERWIDRLIRIGDGTLVFLDYTYVDEEYKRTLTTIDVAAQGFGESVEIPNNVWEIYPGFDDYDFLYRFGSNINGFNLETGESTRLLNWIESDVSGDMIGNITMLPDGRILATNGIYNRVTYEYNYELIVLTRTPYSQLPQRTVITLATFGGWNIREAVVTFNRSNSEYRIRVVDYSEFDNDDDYYAGLKRLSTEIISGRIPDILDVTALPYKQYVGRGLLENLYTLIDADPQINRSDFIDGAFRAAEIDGGLYQIFPSFSINTLVGNPAVLGPGEGWTMDEFKGVLAANPQADFPLGSMYTRMSFIQQAVIFSADEYVNWTNGTTHFDTPNFISLLEFANTLPESYEHFWGGGEPVPMPRNGIATPDFPGDWQGPPSEEELISTGRQLMTQLWLGEFYNFLRYKMMFGGDMVFKGFPTESRNGNSLNVDTCLAISSNSKHKAGAWEFLKVFLDKDWQSNNVWNFPTNKAAFDAMVERNMREQQERYDQWLEWKNQYGDEDWMGGWVEPEPMTHADVAQLMTLIENTSGTTSWNVDQSLIDIISEGVEDFFNGRNTAEGVARIIQSRASILVSERS
ncbi:MAG: extracellular solute-binding protein [Oscillospiraceae bacterium]|nr:extracellular solute-binding protein [Oscillospiraceae bacterium]